MEKNRGTRVIAIIALLAGVAGLSLGFAAFSNTLIIRSQATVNPTNEFKVYFSKTAAPNYSVDPVVPEIPNGSAATATNATIDNTTGANPTISNLHATFTQPGQSVTYRFYAYNKGQYTGYLRSIAFENVTGESTTRICTPGKDANNVDTTASMVTAACSGITVSVQVGSEAAKVNPTSATTYDTYSLHSLAKDASEEVVVVITYAANSALADGPFTVAFGDIKLGYSSVDRSA